MPGINAYRVDGARVVPTEFAAGLWLAEQQHGGAVLAILARYLEMAPTAAPMRLTRITADLSRAVPMDVAEITVEPLRDGRRVQSLVATMRTAGTVVARAVATRLRSDPGLIDRDRVPPRLPDDVAPRFGGTAYALPMRRPNFHDCFEMLDPGTDDEFGNGAMWFRLAGEIVEGEAASPVVRAAAIADMTRSAGTVLGLKEWISINVDVSLQLDREPGSDWMCLDSRVRFGDDGIGTSEGILFDRDGRFGRSGKSLLNYRR